MKVAGYDWPFSYLVPDQVSVGHICQPMFCYHIETMTKWTSFRRWYFQMHFLNENVWILLKISMKFVSKIRINNISALVRCQAFIWTNDGLCCRRIYASLGLNELYGFSLIVTLTVKSANKIHPGIWPLLMDSAVNWIAIILRCVTRGSNDMKML